MRVAVTGANGFVGRALCRHLAELGDSPVALVRAPTDIVGAAQTVVWDTGASEPQLSASVSHALAGCEAVIHAAAHVHAAPSLDGTSDAEFERVNVVLARIVAHAALAAGVGRVVLVSSVKAQAEESTMPLTEDMLAVPADAYGRSKLAAEHAVASIMCEGGGAWCAVRPTMVYGVAGRGNFPRLVQLAQWASRVPLPLGGIDNARDFVCVDNLASALAAATRGQASGVFLVCDGAPLSTPSLLRLVARGLGIRARLWRMSPRLLERVAAIGGRAPDVQRLTRSLRVDSSRIRRTFQWSPPLDGLEQISVAARDVASGS